MKLDRYIPVFTAEEEKVIEEAYQSLVDAYMTSNHRQKVEVIDKAFTLSRIAHAGIRRRSGEPYILHPIAVAHIVCSEMGLGSTSIVCALLHDVVEDTDFTLDDIKERFGDKVALIVDGLTKVSSGKFHINNSAQAESLRKILLTMSNDARVILIKIADRLHNMRTLGGMLPSKQYKIAGETQYIYVPLAHRLGLHSIKVELEDLSFKYEHPENYRSISKKIAETEKNREKSLLRFATPIEKALKAEGIEYELKMRVKSAYSIWRKMQKKGVPFEEIYDIFAVRIVFSNEDGYSENRRCFDIYTAITSLYKVNNDRIRDWVSVPKNNGYRALHVTVMGPEGKWIEVQIRSQRMNEIAEHGLAAHWRYKNELVEEDKEIAKWLDTIRDVVQAPTPDGMDFLDNFKLSLYSEEIWVFTPKGDTIRLPHNSTVLDLAYNIHSELGDHCIGAKIDHRAVPLTTKLKQGDQVEILHSKSTIPQKEWLNYVITPRARLAISSALRRQAKEEIHKGEKMLQARCLELSVEFNNSLIDRLLSYHQYTRKEDFYKAIALGEVNLDTINTNKDIPFVTGRETQISSSNHFIDRRKIYVLREEGHYLNYIVSSCCKPIPGDEALGVIHPEDQIYVHKLSCPIATRIKSTEGHRLVSTSWGEHHSRTFETTLVFQGVDQTGILYCITQILLEYKHINITSINMSCSDGIFGGHLSLMVQNVEEVESICSRLSQNTSIISIHRLAQEVELSSTNIRKDE